MSITWEIELRTEVMVNPTAVNQKDYLVVLTWRRLGNVEANGYEKHESLSSVHLEIRTSKLRKSLT